VLRGRHLVQPRPARSFAHRPVDFLGGLCAEHTQGCGIVASRPMANAAMPKRPSSSGRVVHGRSHLGVDKPAINRIKG
jgi:hypothetical protein